MKLSWLGTEGSGREGKAAPARHRLPVVPQQAGGAAFSAGGVQLGVSTKAKWAAQKLLFPKNKTALAGQQTRLLTSLARSQILSAQKAAPLSERSEGGCPAECVHRGLCFVLPGMYLKQI